MNNAATKFTSVRGTVQVVTYLFGSVTEKRYEEEKKASEHRAEMLTVQFPRPPKAVKPMPPRYNRAMALGAEAAGERYNSVYWDEES